MKNQRTHEAARVGRVGRWAFGPGLNFGNHRPKPMGETRGSYDMSILKSFTSFIVIGIITAGLTITSARAATILETATLGTTGLTAGSVSGAFILSNQFPAARFSLSVTTNITGVGGHLLGNDLFAAIISLPSSDSTVVPSFLPSELGSNALASTIINGGTTSSDAFASLSAILGAGDYALVFGSGLFGATGTGFLPGNNTLLTIDPFFFGSASSWNDNGLSNARFVVEGDAVSVIPLPAGLPLFLTGLAGLGLMRRRKRQA